MVPKVQATMFLAFSRVLTVWATQYFLWCSLFKPPVFLVLSWVLTVLATLFSMVSTVQATLFFAFSRVGANCSSHCAVTCYVSISHPLLMVLTIRASVIFLPSGVINVLGTTILFISLQVYNKYKVLLINYSILKLHLQIFIEAVSSYFTLRLHPPILYWGFVFMIYFEALSS